MRTFNRQTHNNTPAVINFGAASSQAAKLLDSGVYALHIESARVVQKNGNTSVAIDLVEVGKGGRVKLRPIWVYGPNANAGTLAVENQELIAQLLALAGKATQGDPLELIPALAGLTFEAYLVISTDTQTGRTFNALAEILTEGGM
jgi:hypothetical protein